MNNTPFNIIVIAMEREIDRKALIEESLNRAGVTRFSFINATDGKDPEALNKVEGYDKEKALLIRGRELTPSEIACFNSHREAWHFVSNSDLPTLILESDACINKETIDVCKKICQQKKSEWEMVMLYYHECVPSFWKKHKINEKYKLVKFANKRAYISSSILLSPKGARKLLHHADSIYLPADDFMSGGYIDKDINLFAVSPRAARLGILSEVSNIQDERETFSRKKKNKDSISYNAGLKLRNLIRALRRPPKGL
ncbi:MAG: glycosyltransferase family 25 protein [Alcanivorax sp.]|nr:glycosyltransferase family 25 protein [Alcanivorax sp.]